MALRIEHAVGIDPRVGHDETNRSGRPAVEHVPPHGALRAECRIQYGLGLEGRPAGTEVDDAVVVERPVHDLAGALQHVDLLEPFDRGRVVSRRIEIGRRIDRHAVLEQQHTARPTRLTAPDADARPPPECIVIDRANARDEGQRVVQRIRPEHPQLVAGEHTGGSRCAFDAAWQQRPDVEARHGYLFVEARDGQFQVECRHRAGSHGDRPRNLPDDRMTDTDAVVAGRDVDEGECSRGGGLRHAIEPVDRDDRVLHGRIRASQRHHALYGAGRRLCGGGRRQRAERQHDRQAHEAFVECHMSSRFVRERRRAVRNSTRPARAVSPA
jgi:hypothetical protein